MAMCIREGFIHEDINNDGRRDYTGCRDEAIGDNGYAFGAFQINTIYHSLTDGQKTDFNFQLDWTAKRLIAKGYRADHEWYRKNAIKSHNGWSMAAERYALEVINHSNKLAKIL